VGFFDFLHKTDKPMLDIFQESMTIAQVKALLPAFAMDLMRAVNRFSIQFYRNIHSHHSDGFVIVREEVSFLLYFATAQRLRKLYAAPDADALMTELQIHMNNVMSTADDNFSSSLFGQYYEQRIAEYAVAAGSTAPRSNMIAVFSASLCMRLQDWGKLVAFHSQEIAAEALITLEGEG
jgi:hypothetical protein